MLTKDLDGPLDDCSDLGPSELENLQGWVERFDEKVSLEMLLEDQCHLLTVSQYLVVGKLIAFQKNRTHGF